MKKSRKFVNLEDAKNIVKKEINKNKKSKYTGTFLQLRDLGGYEDDFSDNFANTKTNEKKLKRFIDLWNDIKPRGYKPIQLWRVSTERLK